MRRSRLVAALGPVLLVGGTIACSSASVAGDDTGLEPLVGRWRGVLLSPGGELPFALRVDLEGSDPPAVVINAGFESPIESVSRQGAASYVLRFAAPGESGIVARMAPSGTELSGFWRYRRDPEQATALGIPAVTQVPFSATRNDSRRFQRNDPTLEIAVPEGIAAIADLNGLWETITHGLVSPFLPAPLLPGLPASNRDKSLLTGEFIVQNDEHIVSRGHPGLPGMEGIYRDGLLRLSVFDGMRARLVHARAMPDGTLEGALWAPDLDNRSWPWSAQRR
jgi:hypothetical protein